MKKKVDTRELVEKIAKLTRERILADPVVPLEEIKKSQCSAQPPTLLIIDDDETIRRSLQRLFDQQGYKVLAAGNGAELSHVIGDTAIDLIMLDVGLPWLNGYEIATMMKEHEDLKSVPLVFISGHSDMEAIKKGFRVGAHDYITKPFDIEKVKKTVETLLKLSGV